MNTDGLSQSLWIKKETLSSSHLHNKFSSWWSRESWFRNIVASHTSHAALPCLRICEITLADYATRCLSFSQRRIFRRSFRCMKREKETENTRLWIALELFCIPHEILRGDQARRITSAPRFPAPVLVIPLFWNCCNPRPRCIIFHTATENSRALLAKLLSRECHPWHSRVSTSLQFRIEMKDERLCL